MQKVYNLKLLKANYVFFTHFFESVAELVLGDIYRFQAWRPAYVRTYDAWVFQKHLQ